MQNITIALTGGIGAGKSFVAKSLKKRGIEVFDCDEAAKLLMRNNDDLKQHIKELVGKEAYKHGQLNKHYIAQFLLKDAHNAQALNNIVHPAVAKFFENTPQHWLESAILFESEFYKRTPIHVIICVIAPLNLRLQRVIKRDNISKEQALAWINKQMLQEEKAQKATFTIINDGEKDIDTQLDYILDKIKNTNKFNEYGNNFSYFR